MRRLTRHRSGDAPSGEPHTPAPTAPAPQEGTTNSHFLTTELVRDAITDDASTRRLMEVCLLEATVHDQKMRTETACRKELQESAAELDNKRFRNRMIWGVSAFVVVVGALVVFGAFHVLEKVHWTAGSGYGATSFTALAGAGVSGAAVAVTNQVRGWMARRQINVETAPAAPAHSDSQVLRPASPEEGQG